MISEFVKVGQDDKHVYFGVQFKSKSGNSFAYPLYIDPKEVSLKFDKDVVIEDIITKDNLLNISIVPLELGSIYASVAIYGYDLKSGSIRIDKFDPNLYATVDDIIKGDEDEVVVEIHMDEAISGVVNIEFNNILLTSNIHYGLGTQIIPISSSLPTGTYLIKLFFDGNEFYKNSSYQVSFELKEKSTPDNVREFTTLQNHINHNNAMYMLRDDYFYSSINDRNYENGVVISQDNYILDGDGHTIYGNNSARILDIKGNNVTLKNIVFANFNSFDGGAVHFDKSANIINCSFMDGLGNYGGAVYIGAYGYVANSTFINCSGQYGGALYIKGESVVENSSFIKNFGAWGGAIYFNNGSDVSNSNFINNSATSMGGSIYDFGKVLNIIGRNFTGNYGYTGSAIYLHSEGYFKNSVFLDNKASSDTLEINYENYKASVQFYGFNSYAHAIMGGMGMIFSNITYWNGSVVSSIYDCPEFFMPEGINITLEIYDWISKELIDTCQLITDKEGKVYYDFSHFDNWFYEIHAYHFDDSYYTYINASEWFTVSRNSSSVKIDIDDNSEFYYPNIPNIEFTVENSTEVRVVLIDSEGNVYLNSTTDERNVSLENLPLEQYYNLTVYNLGNEAFAPSKDSKTFRLCRANSMTNISPIEDMVYDEHDIVFEITGENLTVVNIKTLDDNGTIVNSFNMSSGADMLPRRLPAGHYTVIATNYGNENIFPSNTSTTFTISKGYTSAWINVADVTYPENVDLWINADMDGDYTVNVNGTIAKVKVINRRGNVLLPLNAGTYDVILSYDNPNYDFSFNPTSFVVHQAHNNINVSVDSDSFVGTAIVQVNADIDGIYTLDINGTVDYMEVVNGKGNKLLFLAPGVYYANVTFENPNYNSSIANLEFEVKNKTNNVIVSIEDVSYPNSVVVIVQADIDGEYLIDINGTSSTVIVENGIGNTTEFLNAGRYYANVTFDNPYYESNITNAEFEVLKGVVDLTFTIPKVKYGEKLIMFVESEVDQIYVVNISGNYQIVNVVDEKGNISLSLNAGSYSVDVVRPNENYEKMMKKVIFEVLKENAVVSASNKAYVINYGGKYQIKLKDSKGKALAKKKVKFTLAGKYIGYATTNSKGVATFKLTAKRLRVAKAGKRNLIVKFAGDANYKATSKTVKIIIYKEKTKIAAKNKAFKKLAKVKKYAISLKNSKGKAVKNVKLSLRVRGKTYTAKTNKKGKAIFNIKNLKVKGKFTSVIKFKGNRYYKPVSKKVKLIVKN